MGRVQPGSRRETDDANEPAKAKREGIMLSAEDFIQKRAASIQPVTGREVILHVPERTYIDLINHARRLRLLPQHLAAEYVIDAVASAQLSLRGVKGAEPEPDAELVQELAEARAALREMKAKLDKHSGQFAKLRNFDETALTSRDDRIAALEQELCEEQALRVGALERMNAAEAERDEARRVAEGVQRELEAARDEIFQLQIDNEKALTALAACARPLPPIITLHDQEPAQAAGAPVELPKVTDATRRLILGLAAAGNSAHAIARDTLIAKAIVEAVLKQAKGGM